MLEGARQHVVGRPPACRPTRRRARPLTRRPTCWTTPAGVSAGARQHAGRRVGGRAGGRVGRHADGQSVSIAKSCRSACRPTCFAKNEHVHSFLMHFTILRPKEGSRKAAMHNLDINQQCILLHTVFKTKEPLCFDSQLIFTILSIME